MTESPTYRTTYWLTMFDEGTSYDTIHPDLESAETDGMRVGCLKGCQRVEVYSPDGTLQALWDKTSTEIIRRSYGFDDDGREIYDETHVSNRWQRLGDESKALGKLHSDKSLQDMKMKLNNKNANKEKNHV